MMKRALAGFLLLLGCLSPVAFAVDGRGLAVTEDSPWFSYYVVDKVAKQQPDITSSFRVSEDEAVRKIDRSLVMAYPKLGNLRPKGIIAEESDQRLAMVYRKMAWYAGNDQVVAAQIVFNSAMRLASRKEKEGAAGLPFLALRHFIFHALCDDEPDADEVGPGGDGCAMVMNVAARSDKELSRQNLRQYVQWAAMGLAFNDRLAYESGVFLMDTENPTRSERDSIKAILKPLVKRDAGKTIH